MTYNVSLQANGRVDKVDDPAPVNFVWALASGRIPAKVAHHIRYDAGCWVYTGTLTYEGYGRAYADGRTRRGIDLFTSASTARYPRGMTRIMRVSVVSVATRDTSP